MNKNLKLLKYHLLKRLFKSRREVPIFIFGYHKCGTKLLGKIFLELSLKYGWTFKSIPGHVDTIPDVDVLFFLHSQVNYDKLPKEYIGIHVVRDPRDIIVSGYLYHKRTIEEWCINKNFQTNKPIEYPQVPNSQMYRSEDWKIAYLKSLNGKSYQEYINSLNQEDGIHFEMNHYGKWTIEDMLKWDFDKTNCLELKFEDLMSDYEAVMIQILDFCKLTPNQLNFAKSIANKEDLSKMSKKEIENNPHISSVQTKKWERYFSPQNKAYFDNHFSDVLKKYNY
ncbi:hypothetical protein C1T31_07145 [Hanstruepera neustonica]|uniref:Sulfotransferase domain-containing protein n=1 Tax=Hanstruepera neustonica TaxID=1445657 RepID=A0A2K1DZ32_9FLAO|nr:sulfotransferase domain-containing protein [Hanstruepera neustonica]PNQ73288.1 hypothetical protein C1T31_07145 [Hanstruepera neustonica]